MLTPKEWKRVTELPTLCMIMTANGSEETGKEAMVYIKDLDIFLCVKLVDDPPAVLSLGAGRFTVLDDKIAALFRERRSYK